MVTLKSENSIAEISEIGAELRSFRFDGTEYIWQGHPEVWGGSAPILFPICGGLRDDKYILNGKEYILNKHGFARAKEFAVENQTENSVTMLITEDSETLKSFPFKFELRVIFTLVDNKLEVKYSVKNMSDSTMYFSIGAHEAYATPEGIEDYDVIFPQNETLDATILDGNLLEKNTIPIIKNSNVLPLYDKYFLLDALVFKDVKSRSLLLRNRKTEKTVKIDYPNSDYLLLWHKYSSAYMCVEPWDGIQDSQDSDYDITHKEGINSLEPNKEYISCHTITVSGK